MSYSILSFVSVILGLAGIFTSWSIWSVIPLTASIIVGTVALTDYLSYKWVSVGGIIFAIIGWYLLVYQLFQPYYTLISIRDDLQNFKEAQEYIEDAVNYQKRLQEPDDVIVNKYPVMTQTESAVKNTSSGSSQTLSFEYKGLEVKYQKFEVTTDYDGNPMVNIYYEFTNNSEENQTFGTCFLVKAFQNGVSKDYAINYTDEDNNLFREIQPGTTLIVFEPRELDDTVHPVDVEVSPAFSWDTDTLMSFTIQLQ